MLNTAVFSVAVGAVLGFLAGLGVGGGSLLILWLTLVLKTDPGTARAINLLFFLTAAGSVSLIRFRKGQLELKAILPAILCGCLAAALICMVRGSLEQPLLKKLFGILLLFTGLRELLYRPRKDK